MHIRARSALFLAVMMIIMAALPAGMAAGLLPSANQLFGEIMPSVALAIGREADDADDLTWNGVTEAEYTKLGQCLAGAGCTLTNSDVQGTLVTLTVAKNGTEMTLCYDPVSRTLQVTYPKGSRIDTEAASPAAASILPEAKIVYSLDLPSVGEATGKQPDQEEDLHDGRMMQSFSSFDDAAYGVFDDYLDARGTTMIGYTVEGNTLTILLSHNGAPMTLVYDRAGKTASFIYPRDARIASVVLQDAQ